MNLEHAVITYLNACNLPHADESRLFIDGTIHPAPLEFVHSILHTEKVVRLATQLIEYIDNNPKHYETVIRIASKRKQTYHCGLAIGALTDITPSKNFKYTKSFATGIIDGQARMASFDKPAHLKQGYLIGGACLALAMYLTTTTPILLDEDSFQKVHSINHIFNYTAAGAYLYGMYSMVRNRLFMRDRYASQTLIMDGQFGLHRNPYYTGLGIAALALIGTTVTPHLFSNDPHFIPSLLALVGIGAAAKGQHEYVLADEALLLKKFGQAYKDYQECTPRYLPAIWKLFFIQKNLKS